MKPNFNIPTFRPYAIDVPTTAPYALQHTAR